MIEYFRKGQIVPRRLGFAKTTDRKAQHNITFGTLVRVEGRAVTALDDGPAIVVPAVKRRMNNGTCKKCAVVVNGFTFVPLSEPNKTPVAAAIGSPTGTLTCRNTSAPSAPWSHTNRQRSLK